MVDHCQEQLFLFKRLGKSYSQLEELGQPIFHPDHLPCSACTWPAKSATHCTFTPEVLSGPVRGWVTRLKLSKEYKAKMGHCRLPARRRTIQRDVLSGETPRTVEPPGCTPSTSPCSGKREQIQRPPAQPPTDVFVGEN